MPRRIVLHSHLALGDIVTLTAVPRELHRLYPGQFQIAVDTPFPGLWEHNPHIVAHADYAQDWERWGEWELIHCHYDQDPIYSVHRSNEHPVHMLTSYCQDVANRLNLPSLYPAQLMGDIHLSREEYGWKSMPHERHNVQRYWLICAGGKTDFTTKWYPALHWQRVVDYFAGRIQFVQVGASGDGHYHPKLDGVINLVGQTDVRQLVRLVHSACGVVCGITSLMHMAAAVPLPTWQRRPRPCVVVAGGRESRTWYSYPTHRILESVGSLPCCAEGGCWQSHTVPLGNPEEQAKQRLCHRVVHGVPRCMALIRPEAVIMEIEKYLHGEGIE